MSARKARSETAPEISHLSEAAAERPLPFGGAGDAAAGDPQRPRSAGPADELIRAIRVHWRIVVAIVVASTVIAWLFAAVQPKRYRASSVAAVAPLVNELEATDIFRGVDTLERRTLVATIAALAATPVTQGRVAAAIGPPVAGYDVDAAVLPNTNLLRISVEGDDPNRVTAVANLVPSLLSAQTRAMYKLYHVTMVSAAAAPREPVMPRIGRSVAAGMLIGTALGAVVAYAMRRRSLPAS